MTTDSGTSYEFTVGDHNEQMHEYISDLIDEAYRRKKGGGNGNEAGEGAIPEPTTPQERVHKADRLCEDYYVQLGVKPASGALSRLAWYVIFDDMTDSHPDKMSREEYPIMSDHQARVRRKREIPTHVFFDAREYVGRRKVAQVVDDLNDDMGDRSSVDRDGKSFVYNSISDVKQDEHHTKIDVLSLLENAGLTGRQREAIELVYFDGMTQEGAAEVMGVSDRAVRYFINDGIAKIRREVTKATS